ncbi:MAG: radical SAM protein [Deltaproteobacteria bacterium]|nr:radical SAM protein [Candidatus Zymogenaceae bacterium]
MKNIKRFIIPIFIPHAGCPHRCLFCDQQAITSAGAVKLTRGHIVETVNSYTETRPDWERDIELAFFGGSFTLLPMKRQLDLLKIGKELIDMGRIDALRVSTRPDAISEKVLGFLEEYGVRTIELGIQSMSDHILELSQRGHTADDTRRAALLIKRRGFDLIAQIMPGLPGDTESTIMGTAEDVINLVPSGVRIYPTVVIKDTEMERLYREGRYVPLSLDETVRITGLIVRMFQEHDIPIIRIGLSHSKDLEKRVVSGPYHESLGALVMEGMMAERIERVVGELSHIPDPLVIRVHPRLVGAAVGGNKRTIRKLEKVHNLNKVKITGDRFLTEEEIVIENL